MKSLFLFVATGLLLSGCGSSDPSSLTTGSTSGTSASSSFSSRVVAENGQGVADVDVVVHDRLTNLKYTAKTGSDGSFTLDTPPGVYDLGLNKATDPSSATCFYGPITNFIGSQTSFVLRGTGGRPVNSVFGRVVTTFANPRPLQNLVLRPSLIHAGATADSARLQPLLVPQSSDGSFEALLDSSQPLTLDIEAYDKSGLDEFIDIAKLDKACFVQFTTEDSQVENRLRGNESDGPNGLLATNLRVRQNSSIQPKLEQLFNGKLGTSLYDAAPLATLTDGLLSVDDLGAQAPANIYHISDIIQPASNPHTGIENSLIAVDNNGMWWFKYAVHIQNQTGVGSEWWFTDETNDTYSLYIFGNILLVPFPVDIPLSGSWHKVSYNSNQPNIKKIVYRL